MPKYSLLQRGAFGVMAAAAMLTAPLYLGHLEPLGHFGQAQAANTQQDQIGNSISDWQPSEDDFLLLDIRSGRFSLGNGVRGYQTPNGICIDFADIIMSLNLPVRLDKKSRRATGWIFAEQETLIVDRDQRMVQTMNGNYQLQPDDIYDSPEGWCVDSKALSKWLGVDLTPDLSNALLLLNSDRQLPFQRAAERKEKAAKIRPEKIFDLADMPQAKQPYKFWQTPSVDAVLSAGGLRDTSSSRANVDVRYEFFASGEIGKASVDARLASNNDAMPESLRIRAFRSDPNGGLLGPAKATQIAAGDISTFSTPLVAQSVIGRGAFISNRPLNRGTTFDRTSFRGALPVGWDAELYRNNQLIAFAENRDDGRYEFIDVPLLFGRNDFEVVLYGPQGQIRRERRSQHVGADALPPGETYYWAGLAESGRDLITIGARENVLRTAGLRGSIGVEHGLDKRTTLAGAVHSLNVDGQRINIAELGARRAFGNTLFDVSLAGDNNGATAFRGQALGRFGNSFFRAETIWASGGFRSDQIEQNVNSQYNFALSHFFSSGGVTIPVELDAIYRTGTNGADSLNVTSRLSANLQRLSVTAELDYARNINPFGPDPDDQIEAGLLANLRLGKFRLRGESRFSVAPDSRFRSATIVGEWRNGSRNSWRTELGFNGESGRTRLALGYIRQFDKFSLNSSIEAASDGSFAAGINLAFSLGPDPRNGRIRLSNERLASNGQVLATVFRDTNRDGIRQPDEPLEKDVELTAGLAVALQPTDENGRALIDGLSPFQPILVGIDGGSLPDPYLQPSTSGVVVTPRPGVPSRIELPLVAAGEVDGTLVRAGGIGIGGVTLELIDATGQVKRTALTEFDGFFLFESVPYGAYKMRIAQESAKILRAAQAVPNDRIILDDENPLINLGAVRISSLEPQIAQKEMSETFGDSEQ